METLLPGNTATSQSYSPQLKTVLKTYQLSAVKSLQGPSSALLDCKSVLLHEQQSATPCYSPPASRPTVTCGGGGGGPESPGEPKDVVVEKEGREASTRPVTPATKTPCSLEDSDEDRPATERLKSACEKRELEFQIPILTAPDQSRSERRETVLEGERISCFEVGGEKRLCLPQILNTVLQDFTLQQINQVCDELQIYCSRCTPDQLEGLKQSGILPHNAPSCGLITQTDAERLVSALLLRTDSCKSSQIGQPQDCLDKKVCGKSEDEEEVIVKFKVYHECFGKCKGVFDAELFETDDSACIECLECGYQFSPQRFVRHAHRSLENRTCHWGFDSANWRSYLLLCRDQQHYNKSLVLFRELKDRPLTNTKRKLELRSEYERLAKRTKKDPGKEDCAEIYNTNGLGIYHSVSQISATDPYFHPWSVLELRGASAFRPWNGNCKLRANLSLAPSYLSRGPPVLQNPERVIPLSECKRFEPHFQPNVALAPVPSLGQIPPSSSLQQRHYHEQRCHNHRMSSAMSEKQEQPISSANVKLEKKSPSQQALAVGSYPPYYVSEDRRQKEATPPKDVKTPKMGEEEEEEESAAVTSSTVNVGPPSLAASSGGTLSTDSSDSDLEPPKTEEQLEERLSALHVPQDVIEEVRRIRLEMRSCKREMSKLRSRVKELEQQQQQQQQAADGDAVVTSETQDKKEEATAPRASAADSTEAGGEDADATSLPSDTKDPGSGSVLATNSESDQ